MFQDRVGRRFLIVCGLLIGLVLMGTCGYRWLEGWGWLDGFFMTVITVSTVGYGEPTELSDTGRLFTSALIAVCIIATTCWTAALTSFLIENDLSGHFTRRRMNRMIDKLEDHTVVCGTTALARTVIDRLLRKRVPVVLVDDDREQLETLRRKYRQLLIVEGKPTNELVLAKANLLTARHVVAATPSEVDNLLIGITCKELGSNLSVFAESNDTTVANRMRKAGVDEVVSPVQLCGERMVQLVTDRPASATATTPEVCV